MFKFLFSPNGRVSRSGIWLKFLLPYILLSIAASIIDRSIGTAWMMKSGEGYAHMWMLHRHGPVAALLGLFYLWPSFAVPIKRYHDRGMTGWWVLFSILLLIPGIVVGAIGVAHSGITMENIHAIDPSQLNHGALLHMVGGMLWCLLIAVIFFVILYVLPGHQGENKYGPDPRGGS